MGKTQSKVTPLASTVEVENMVDKPLADIVENVATNKGDDQQKAPFKIDNPNAEILSIPGIGDHPRFHVGVTRYFFPWLMTLVKQHGEIIPPDISTEQLVWGVKCAGPTGPSPISWNIADQTREHGCSFIVWCLINGYNKDSNGCPLFAPVTTFVSHAWKNTFQALHDSINQKSQIVGDAGATAVPAYFLDIFVVNQHIPPWREQPCVGMDHALRQPIERSHKTLLVMSPFEDPVPLKRAWCIYEICNTSRLNAVLDITMPAVEHARFIDALTKGEFDFNDWVANIDIEAAGAFDAGDKKMIMDLVQSGQGGAAALNRTVVTVLCEWLSQQGYLALHKLSEKERGTSKLIKNLANVLLRQGKHDEAEPLFNEMVQCRREVFGNTSAYTLDGLHIWGRFLRVRGRHDEARKILEETVAGRQIALGQEHPDTLTSQMELAEVMRFLAASNEGALADVERAMTTVVETWRKLLTSTGQSNILDLDDYSDKSVKDMHINFLESLKVYAAVMMQHKKASTAIINATVAELLAGRLKLFGPRNPATLDAIMLQTQHSLSCGMNMDNRTSDTMEDALSILRGTLGNKHPRTLNCICLLSLVVREQVSRDEIRQERIAMGSEKDYSLELIKEAVAGYEVTLGPHHPDTKWAKGLEECRQGDIAAYIEKFASCFSPLSRVLMSDGITTKCARDVEIGDYVATPSGNGFTRIIGHTIQREGKPRPLIALDSDLLISKMHRIQHNGQWIRPQHHPDAKEVYAASELHNFVVENRSPIIVNGLVVATIGTFCEGTHDCQAKPNHRLWASSHIVDVFKHHPAWPVVVLDDDDLFLRAIKNKDFAQDYLTSLPHCANSLLAKYGWTADRVVNQAYTGNEQED